MHQKSAWHRKLVSSCQERGSIMLSRETVQESVHPESGNFKGGYDKEKEKNLKKSAEKT